MKFLLVFFQMKLFSVEGVIGCGKTTLLKRLEQRFKDSAVVSFHHEPVDQFQQLFDNELVNPLQTFYENTKKNAFAFQTYVLDVYDERVERLGNSCKSPAVMQDRGAAACNVFCDLNSEHFTLFEKQYLEGRIRNLMLKERKYFGPDYVLYMEIDPEKALTQIKLRDRPGEENITVEYLEKLDLEYKSYLEISKCPNKVFYLEKNEDPLAEVVSIVQEEIGMVL